MSGRHEDTVAVVTGSAGGIGSAVCERLAADGFAVVCLDAREADVSRQAASLPVAIGVATDVRDAASVRAAGIRIRAELGPPWLLANVAGVFSIQLITELA